MNLLKVLELSALTERTWDNILHIFSLKIWTTKNLFVFVNVGSLYLSNISLMSCCGRLVDNLINGSIFCVFWRFFFCFLLGLTFYSVWLFSAMTALWNLHVMGLHGYIIECIHLQAACHRRNCILNCSLRSRPKFNKINVPAILGAETWQRGSLDPSDWGCSTLAVHQNEIENCSSVLSGNCSSGHQCLLLYPRSGNWSQSLRLTWICWLLRGSWTRPSCARGWTFRRPSRGPLRYADLRFPSLIPFINPVQIWN